MNANSEDYYINEDGLIVMTESFLKKRGFCCANGCKHCPYTKPRKRGNTDLENQTS